MESPRTQQDRGMEPTNTVSSQALTTEDKIPEPQVGVHENINHSHISEQVDEKINLNNSQNAQQIGTGDQPVKCVKESISSKDCTEKEKVESKADKGNYNQQAYSDQDTSSKLVSTEGQPHTLNVQYEEDAVESPSIASRLKGRNPHLKALVTVTQSTSPTAHNSSGMTSFGSLSQFSKSAGMKRINSANTLELKGEEDKNEPLSASQKQKVSMEDFHKITTIGKGSYGEVFLVKKISTNKLFALKVLDKNFMLREKKQYQVYVEKEVLLKMNHPNVIKLYSSFQDKYKLYFVLEYVSGGEFSDYLRIQGKLSKPEIIFFAAEIVNILEYIHTFGIAHRDMKPENLLLTQEGHLKCIDFATAKPLTTEKRTAELYEENEKKPKTEETLIDDMNSSLQDRGHRATFVGTAQYVSPEMLEGIDCGAPADLWSLGCMLYLMAVGKFPFSDVNEYLIFEKIKVLDISYPEGMDSEIKDLIQKLLVIDPMMRLGAGPKGSGNDYEALKAHPLFKGVNFATLHEQKPPIIEIASPHKKKMQDLIDPVHSVSTQNRKHYNSDDLTETTNNKPNKPVRASTDKAVKVVLSGLVMKKCGWIFFKPRQLILSTKPKLVYYDPDTNELKGEIVLLPTTKAELESGKKFTISTPSRKYYFKEIEHSAEKWVETVNNMIKELYPEKK